ncbi:hypothetical protein HJ167_19875 [Vibrio parahaemolyticus]|nr:hypothetical protein [Vibrio parahaemolyticus]
MSNLQLTISSPELNRKGKLVLINQYLKRCSGKVTIYSCAVADDTLMVSPEFKTQDALSRVEAGINEILENMCEEMDGNGDCCHEHYNCCDCGGNDCGCPGCFSCKACPFCKEEDE